MRDAVQATWSDADRALLKAVRTTAPRVQCLTNTVAQAYTAHCLHAIGAGASMATHASEVEAMSISANAVLINLGTIDEAREAAISILMGGGHLHDRPVVLDPVFVHASPVRLKVARLVLDQPRLIVKGNRVEMASLLPHATSSGRTDVVWITTGPIDRVVSGNVSLEICGGHPWMAAVSGLGCALGAVVAACAAVSSDRLDASRAAVRLFAAAGDCAALRSAGPGSFAVAFIDELHRLTCGT